MASGREGDTLYIAGSSSAVPRPGRANSGYLLHAGECVLAIDFGSGVFSRAREHLGGKQLDALVISHMHADHFFDIVPLRYALRYEMPRSEPLRIFLPPGGIQVAEQIAAQISRHERFYDGVIDLREYDPQRELRVGDCTVRFAPSRHYIPAFAMRVETPSSILGYSADTAPCESVSELVRDADIFLCEAALGADGTESEPRGHLNAREAGALAQQSGVRHLILTHYGAAANPQDLRAAAQRSYSGKVTVADDGMAFSLRAHGPMLKKRPKP